MITAAHLLLAKRDRDRDRDLLEVEDQGGHPELDEHVRRVPRDFVGAFDGRQRGGERRKLPASVSICTLVLVKQVN